jgi:IPT/TIG domain
MKLANTIFLSLLLTVGLACGYSSKPTTPAVAGSMPNITALSPNSVKAGTTGNSFMVTGTNFNGNATINWNGTALATTFTSASLMTAAVPDADVAAAGTATVTVTNPGTAGGIYGGGTSAETSNSMTFTIN